MSQKDLTVYLGNHSSQTANPSKSNTFYIINLKNLQKFDIFFIESVNQTHVPEQIFPYRYICMNSFLMRAENDKGKSGLDKFKVALK
jgi:hypothetical protein